MNATFLPRRSAAITAGLVSAALLAGGLTIAEAAGAAEGPTAVTAKKKCGKKCKKRKAKKFLAGNSLSKVSYSGTTGASSTLRFDFCQDGSLRYRGDYVGGSGYAWADSYQGTWSVASATKSAAKVNFTTSNYQVSDPYYASPPAPSGTVTVQAQSDVVVLLEGVEFSRGAGAC